MTTNKSISTIMIVDDSPSDQLLSKLLIEQYDPTIEVLQAYDDGEALEMLKTLSPPPDLILLDINMPGMDGHTFLEKHSAKNDAPPPVIVMLTSSSLTKDKEKALSYNCVKKYSTKPLNTTDLSFF